jgi:hypothetical protein
LSVHHLLFVKFHVIIADLSRVMYLISTFCDEYLVSERLRAYGLYTLLIVLTMT